MEQLVTIPSSRAVLWDLDGTLVDSGEFHWLSWRSTLLQHGFRLERHQFLATFGLRNDDVLKGLLGADLAETEIRSISAQKEEDYRQLIRNHGLRALPGVKVLIKALQEAGWRQAIASSAPMANIQVILDAIQARPYFDTVVSAEDVKQGKPNPEIFLLAAKQLQIQPQKCIVVEDAPAGIVAAKRAEMRCIGVLTTQKSLVADRVVKSLEELSELAFAALLL